MQYAVIDIGSNSVRCVVFTYDAQYHRLKKIENLREYPQLLHYVNNQNELSDKGIHVLSEALLTFKKVIDMHEVTNIFCVATAALRAATNQVQIIETISAKTGITIQIISPEMEAYYGLMAVRFEEPTLKDAVLIDMGGGSTEVSLMKDQKITDMKSFPYGVVNLTDTYFTTKQDDVDYAADCLKHQLFQWRLEVPFVLDTKLPLVLIGGSARNCAKLFRFINQQKYVSKRVHMLTQRDMHQVYRFAIQAKKIDFMKVPRFTIERHRTIKSSAVVFRMLSKFVDAPVIFVCNHGVREGVIYDYLQKNDLL
ncbi:MAG: hypothetical protein ACRDAO_05195 [Culicoidibacterales bacterium]